MSIYVAGRPSPEDGDVEHVHDFGEPDEPDDAEPAPGRPWYRRHAWLLPTLVVAIAIALPARGVLRAPGPPMEEGFMLVFPERVLAGDVPNRDFLHLYGPGSLWTIAGLFQVFGVSLWTARAFGLLQLVALIAGVAYVGHRFGRWPAIVAGVVSAVIIIPPIGVTPLAWVGGVALGLWAVNLALRPLDGDRDRTWRWTVVVAGLLAGLALLFRPDLVLALGLPLGALWWWAFGRRARRHLVAGLLAGVSPFLVHLALAGPANAVRGMILEPVFDLRAGRSLPFPPRPGEIASFLQRSFGLREFPWPFPEASLSWQGVLWFWALLVVTVALVVMGWRAKRAGSPHGWRLVAISLFAVGLLPQALQRSDTAHLAWVSCVTFGVLPAYIAETLRLRPVRLGRLRPQVTLRLAVATPVLLLLLFPAFTLRWYVERTAESVDVRRVAAGIEHQGRFFYYGREDVAAAANALLHDASELTQAGQSLVVGTGDLRKTPYSEAYLYFMLPDLEPGTRYIELDPGVANAPDSGLADELRDADVVILSTVYDDWDEPNASRDYGSGEPNRVIEEDFCLHDDYGDNGPDRPVYELYLRCERAVG